MTSRHLRSLLPVVMAPLAIGALAGCNQFFGLEETRLIVDNKLSCDCECSPMTPDPIVSLRVVAPSDDAEQDGVAMTLGSGTLDLGQSMVGVRFESLKIPRKANIVSAVVRFTADATDAEHTGLTIYAEQSAFPATFTTADDDLGGRTLGSALPWPAVAPWTSGDASAAEETPELKGLLQPLVDRPDWTDASSLVLRFDGLGHRRAVARQTGSSRAALLEVRYTTGVEATLPVCASSNVDRDSGGRITAQGQADECARVEATLAGLAGPCGYPAECTCAPNAAAGTSDADVCVVPCDEVPVDATCSNFDPNAFERCLQDGTSTLEDCKVFVQATNAPGDSPVCVPSGSALAFHAFGSRSLCEVHGTSHIQVGDREPEQDPETEGIVEFVARPCPNGGCRVQPYFDLRMDPITFSVRWHSDPTFTDLSATGRGLEPAVHAGGEISYPAHAAAGTGNGRRLTDFLTNSSNLAVDARNSEPLDFGIDWTARQCDMVGSVAGAVGDDSVCAGDGTTPCAADSPDCDAVGGPCTLPDDTEQMQVDVALAGAIVNQPPTAVAGPDRNVECTSPAGAPFALDGRGSSDPDQNLALASWREDSRIGPLIVNGLNAELALGLGESRTYVLRVIDSFAQTDEDTTSVSVVDTTPPDVFCNAPSTITPPKTPVSFAATASDVCTASVIVPELVDFECFKINGAGKRVDKTTSCKVTLDGPTITIRNSVGVGNHIVWTARGVDGSGNVRDVTCEVEVTNPGRP